MSTIQGSKTEITTGLQPSTPPLHGKARQGSYQAWQCMASRHKAIVVVGAEQIIESALNSERQQHHLADISTQSAGGTSQRDDASVSFWCSIKSDLALEFSLRESVRIQYDKIVMGPGICVMADHASRRLMHHCGSFIV